MDAPAVDSAPPVAARAPKLPHLTPPVDDGGAGRSLPLFLSLFLLLLAFFVVLNSLSRFEGGRGAQVVASVHAAFPQPAPPRLLTGVRRDDPGVGPATPRLSGVAEAFETVLGGESQILRQTADRLVLEIGADRLFDGGTSELSPAGADLVRRIMPSLRTDAGAASVSVALLTGLRAGESLAVAPPRVRQAAALAAALRAGGVSGRHLEIGAERAGSARLRLVFDIAKRLADAS